MAIGVLIAIGVLNLLLNSLLLWISCKLLGARVQSGRLPGTLAPVSFRRSVGVAFGAWLLLTGVVVVFAYLVGDLHGMLEPRTVLALVAGCQFLLLLMWLKIALPLRRGSVFLLTLLWYVLTGATSAVLMLSVQATLLEGFVIPTGGMAPTLYCNSKIVTCPDCGHQFAVNASRETDPPGGDVPSAIIACTCPNCRLRIDLDPRTGGAAANPRKEAGDRMLVAKGLLAKAAADWHRNDLLVFYYPDSPPGKPSLIYVQRLIGLPGETIAVHRGHFYVLPVGELAYKDSALPASPLRKNVHDNDPEALKRFHAGAFEIVRNSPELLLQNRQLVYDNDHPAKETEHAPPRWASDTPSAFVAADEHGFLSATTTAVETAWLRYRHQLCGNAKPALITDFSGYNSCETGLRGRSPSEDWVGDLILEGEVTVQQPRGELILELSRGVDRFRTTFDLATGQRRFTRVTDGKETELFPATNGAPLTGTCKVRVANVADALQVWVNEALLITITYPAAEREGPTAANDLEPASIGVRGASVKLQHLTLWRDNYCPVAPARSDAVGEVDWSNPATWDSLRNLPVQTFYVQPDHYFTVGDNARESSDSRTWGLVPRNLLLGQPFFVYYPWGRTGFRH